eukprot:6252120-Amphidinium_carterae.1
MFFSCRALFLPYICMSSRDTVGACVAGYLRWLCLGCLVLQQDGTQRKSSDAPGDAVCSAPGS